MWPVQFYLNFLPPSIRYLPENIIVTTVFYGAKKPDVSKLLFPLAQELEANKYRMSLHTTEDEIVNFIINIVFISCDLPARAAVQNFVGPNGKFGCSICYHPGVQIVNLPGKMTTIRYIQQHEVKLRNHKETVNAYKLCREKPVNGIKGASSALMISDIDMIHSFPIDYMHGIALGVMKDLIEIWLGKKRIPKPPYSEFKLKSHQIETLKKRILSLKPPVSWRRRPRSIVEVANFKASELLNYMWFYLRYTLTGLLSTRIIKHFEMLSAAAYILCRDVIKSEEIKLACDLLINFANEFENIYGQGAVTMNVHLLRHYFEMVTNCGPLWSYSLFGFENNIGVLKRLVNGNVDVLEQISKKYLIFKIKNPTANIPAITELRGKDSVDLSDEFAEILSNAGAAVVKPFQIWRRLVQNGESYTSARCIREKSCDNFIRLKNDQIGIVQFYFELENKNVLLLKLCEESNKNYHWIEVLQTNNYEIHPCCDIAEKLIYFKAFGANFMTSLPNRYIRAQC